MTSLQSEYHYTLYYYDQAGNLVKTVPPAGVRPIHDLDSLSQVTISRAAGTVYLPMHELATVYRYNSLNQVVSQQSPDGGLSNFWYDRLGRLSVSQNAKQQASDYYSYTLYDALGRIREVGEKEQPNAISDLVARDDQQLLLWINYANTSYPHRQVTRTVYDNGSSPLDVTALTPRFTPKTYTYRNRVAYTQYFDQLSYGGLVNGYYQPQYNNYEYGAYYGYDIHGNVEQFLHHYKTGALNSFNSSHAFKVIHYGYDLISGKVNYVGYQPGLADELHHRYEYDAENRLTDVYTTHRKAFVGDRNVEEKEAAYDYYAHGPLARTELGNNQVQGLDYAYTLQGWLKGVNSTALNPAYDMGADGASATSARDAMAFSLNYFMGDYKAINNPPAAPFAEAGSYIGGTNYKALYNGNISHITNSLQGLTTQLYNYRYDQLNRLVGMTAYNGFNHSSNSWSGLTATGLFGESISYDANGNIRTYHRDGDQSGTPAMDRLSYHYTAGTNKLDHITETVPSGNYADDMENQSSGNYAYDDIGNLVQDNAEGITSIDWSVYGKIRQITRSGQPTITYSYDAAGNRISKTVGSQVTWYVRDAQGNTLSTYAYDGTTMTADEQYLYGSARLGAFNRNLALSSSLTLTKVTVAGIGDIYSDDAYRGKRQYELSNHLGNVLATISDKKVWNSGNSSFDASVLSASDYYPFGMQMPGRTLSASGYRYGFNGQEMSNEIKGAGNSYTAEFWEYDPRLGRRWNLDPKPIIGISQYSTFNGNPILFSDLKGDTIKPGAGFWANAWEGLKQGGRDTKNFVKSLGTAEGWSNLAEGMHTMTSSDPVSMIKKAQIADNVIEAVKNAPDMNADEWGHAVGYGTEKIAESVLLSKGAGMVKNAVAGSTEVAVAAKGVLSFESKLAQRGILGFTEHGAEQMAARGFTQDAVLKIIKEGVVKEVVYKGSPQTHYVLGQYRIATAVSGRNAGKIISIMGDISTEGANGIKGIFTGF